MTRRPTDPAALTDDHSPDHWTHAGRHWARTLGDTDRIGPDGVRNALANLEQHLADGCPEPNHRHIGEGTCRHVVREGPQNASGGPEPPDRYVVVDTRFTPTGTAARAKVRIICGQPLPCPLHPQAVLQGVEAEVARRAETVRMGDRLAREADAALVAMGRLRSTVEQIMRLGAAPAVKPERCSGGWGDSADPTCTDAAGHWTNRGGVFIACCSRCYKRSWAADRRAS